MYFDSNIKLLRKRKKSLNAPTWSKRQKACLQRLRTGSIFDVADVLRRSVGRHLLRASGRKFSTPGQCEMDKSYSSSVSRYASMVRFVCRCVNMNVSALWSVKT